MDKSKKLVALIVITLILTSFFNKAVAQEDDETGGLYVEQQRTFYAGFIAGTNLSQVDGDYFAGYHKVGFNGGGIAYAQFKKHLAASIEILYAQEGSKGNGPREVGNGSYILDYGIKLNYAQVPIMINYFDKRKSHFGAGLAYSRLISSSENLTTAPASNLNLAKYPFNSNGLDGVAGFELHLVKGLFLNVRFQYSIIPIRTNVLPDYSRAKQYNNLFAVRLMYLFI